MQDFKTPIDEFGNHYWVPVVAKNRDWLIGFLYGYHTCSDQLNSAMSLNCIDLNFQITEFPINSYRYNNILPNGKDSSKLSEKEFEDYINNINNEVMTRTSVENKENEIPTSFLKVDCTCGLGFYSWDSEKDIPSYNLKCSNCGKFIILYTEIDESNFNVPKNERDKES